MVTDSFTEAQMFYEFLTERLAQGTNNRTPEDLVKDWRENQREYDETVAAVKEGVEDMEAGRMRPLRDLIREAENDRRND